MELHTKAPKIKNSQVVPQKKYAWKTKITKPEAKNYSMQYTITMQIKLRKQVRKVDREASLKN
jgi:hypothetical protein